MSVSTQFAALDALIAMTTTAVGSGAVVIDGPAPSSQMPSDYVMIGVGDADMPDPWPDASQGTTEWATIGAGSGGNPPSLDERFVISGVVVSWSGSGSFASLRAKVKANLAAIESAVRTDPTLQGSVMYSRLTLLGIRQISASAGPAVQARFQVEARSRI